MTCIATLEITPRLCVRKEWFVTRLRLFSCSRGDDDANPWGFGRCSSDSLSCTQGAKEANCLCWRLQYVFLFLAEKRSSFETTYRAALVCSRTGASLSPSIPWSAGGRVISRLRSPSVSGKPRQGRAGLLVVVSEDSVPRIQETVQAVEVLRKTTIFFSLRAIRVIRVEERLLNCFYVDGQDITSIFGRCSRL